MFAQGHQLGPYRIERLLERGGMAEIYKARDTRLERSVAIKVLHRHASGSPKLRERFEVEARAISGLSHPSICRLFDLGRDGDVEFLVLEFLEGETLSDRLDKGPLPFEECLQIAVDMAEALDHAHRRAILHRDIKPSNIMLTNGGARLLDFGVAKLLRPATDSETDPRRLKLEQVTEDGKIVGTYDYMAPEQLEGKHVDARTDIFSLGAVIYEMATQERALRRSTGKQWRRKPVGEDAGHSGIRKILEPLPFNHVVEVCLNESPEDRWQSARDLANELRWIQRSQTGTSGRRIWKGPRSWAAAMVITVLIVGGWIASGALFHRPNAYRRTSISLGIPAPKGTSLDVRMTGGMFAASPDGQRLAFLATQNDITTIWIRSLSDNTPVQLKDTDGAAYPFWSPDSRTIGFFAGGKLKIVDVAGSPATVVCDAPDTRGGSWSKNGTILFSPQIKGGLYAVTLQNRVPRQITHPPANSFESHRWPSFLPDGKHFLYSVLASSQPGIYVGTLDESNAVPVLPDVSKAEYSAALGRLFYLRNDNLVAQPFDPNHLHLSGETIRITTGIPISNGYGAFSASDSGLIAYRAVGSLDTQLSVCDKSGKTLEILPIPSVDNISDPSLSPNRDGLAVTLATGASALDVWILELSSGRFYPLTKNGVSTMGIWAPDGRHISLTERIEGNSDLYETELGSGSSPTLLYHSAQEKVPIAWSHDGRYLVYCVFTLENKVDYMVLPIGEKRAPYLLLRTSITRPQAVHAAISPDDRWIAFTSSESGVKQIYVSPFPGPIQTKYQVSLDGGTEPTWDNSGHTLYYLSLHNRMMKVDLRVGEDIIGAKPEELFQNQHLGDNGAERFGMVEYVLIPNGPRFVLVTRSPRRADQDIEVFVD
jgi:eukaryotic-like serine/threonine-protein kinase